MKKALGRLVCWVAFVVSIGLIGGHHPSLSTDVEFFVANMAFFAFPEFKKESS